MKELKFRNLRADEIEVRVQSITQYGVGLLLYKDARVDMNMLDEVVGPGNWTRKHTRDNANCIVGIWDEDKGMFIEKEDVGSESNVEKQKGLASDSFKRACTNWGIGRELYTAPDMFIRPENLKSHKSDGNRWSCRDRFKVAEIEYDKETNRIKYVKIRNLSNGAEITFNQDTSVIENIEDRKQKMKEQTEAMEKTVSLATEGQVAEIKKLIQEKGVNLKDVLSRYNVIAFSDMTSIDANKAIAALKKTKAKADNEVPAQEPEDASVTAHNAEEGKEIASKDSDAAEHPQENLTAERIAILGRTFEQMNINAGYVLKLYGVMEYTQLTNEKYINILRNLDKILEKAS